MRRRRSRPPNLHCCCKQLILAACSLALGLHYHWGQCVHYTLRYCSSLLLLLLCFKWLFPSSWRCSIKGRSRANKSHCLSIYQQCRRCIVAGGYFGSMLMDDGTHSNKKEPPTTPTRKRRKKKEALNVRRRKLDEKLVRCHLA